MQYPIVQVQTKGGLWLHGLYLEADTSKDSKTIFIHIHGTASNFYEEDFIEAMTKRFLEEDVSMLSTNNRGVGVYDAWDGKGAATEIFEDCIFDIDAWMEFALKKGFQNIILSGHSLGTEKVVYYMAKGKYTDRVGRIVLLAPADSAGWRLFDHSYKPSVEGKDRVEMQLRDAQKMVDEGKGDELMNRRIYGGIMPKTPQSMLNFWGPDTEILKTLPFHTGTLPLYREIRVPILAIIGDGREYTSLAPDLALALMKKENSRTETCQLKNCDHDFTDCEEELAELVFEFI